MHMDCDTVRQDAQPEAQPLSHTRRAVCGVRFAKGQALCGCPASEDTGKVPPQKEREPRRSCAARPRLRAGMLRRWARPGGLYATTLHCPGCCPPSLHRCHSSQQAQCNAALSRRSCGLQLASLVGPCTRST